MTELWAITLVFIAAFVGSFGSLLLKMGANKLEFKPKALMRNWEIIVGLGIYVLSTVFYVIGLKGGELSVLFPIISTGYVWIVIWSHHMLGEKMNRTKIGGILCIILGVCIIGLSSA